MENTVKYTMYVDKVLAEYLNDKGFLEAVVRSADAKFRAFPKIKLYRSNAAGDSLKKKIAASFLQADTSGSLNIESVRHTMRMMGKSLGNKVSGLNASVNSIAIKVDGLTGMLNTVTAISCLNTGLSLANTAVSAAGFIVVSHKLNVLNNELHLAAVQLERIGNVQKNMLLAEGQKLIMRYNSITQKLSAEEKPELGEMEALLIDMRAYISGMIMNLNDQALETETALNIIYTLLPAYTIMFNEFNKHFYFKNTYLSANYSMFCGLYDELEQAAYQEKLTDHYFIDKKCHCKDVIDLINTHKLLGINGKVQIEDQVVILQTLENREDVEKLEDKLDKCIKSWARDNISLIAEKSGTTESQCIELLDLSA